MRAEKSVDSVYLFSDREEIKPFMLNLARSLFSDDDFYICAIVLLNEFELHPTEENYKRLMDKLDINHMITIMDESEALQFSDELVEVIFPKEVQMATHPSAPKNKLRLARICGFCGDGYIAEKRGHDGCVQSSRV